MSCTHPQQKQKKDKRAIIKFTDKLWNVISIILPTEKPNNTVGSPIVPYRKVLYVVSCIFLEPDANSGRCCLENMVLASHVISDFLENMVLASHVISDFLKNGFN